VDAALYLADEGHKVFLIEALQELMINATPLNYKPLIERYWGKQKNFSFAVNARCTKIEKNKVTFVDANGVDHEAKAGSVVMAVGMKSRPDDIVGRMREG
jgi:flavanone/flavanol-cleaving reductase